MPLERHGNYYFLHDLILSSQYAEALRYYFLALSVSPNNASTYAAIAFTYQLQGNLFEAVDNYHKCLALKPEDSFATDMLTQCLDMITYT
jgi:anaphase-promoting complex subunit 6